MQLKGPHQSVGVQHINSRGHANAWKSTTSTQRATPKHRSPYPQLKRPYQSVRVKGHAKAWECFLPNPMASGVEHRAVNQVSSIAPEGSRNWPGFVNSTGRLEAHIGTDWLHHPCLLRVPMVGTNRPRKSVDMVGRNKKVEMDETS